MNLRWNTELRRFEAEFHNFASEQPMVKAVGFKTDGPPEWAWYTTKALVLAKLKGTPGLTISPDAKVEFNRLLPMEERNEALKTEAKKAKKELQKTLKNTAQDKLSPTEYLDAITGIVCLKVEPKAMPVPSTLEKIIDLKNTPCIICKTPVYSYEYAEGGPVVCLWCQKIVLDKPGEVC